MNYVVKELCLLLFMPVLLLAHDMSLHMKIAAENFDIWEDYDPDFYNRMTTPAQNIPDSVLKMMTYKFYYIGTTFPDVLWPNAQSLIRGLITKLYDYRDNLDDPMHIQEWTKNNVQVPIIFPSGTNSHNLHRLYQMVEYAKSNNWTPYEKSMIYGAYVHALCDMYATFAQASRFGYGKCYDSDSAIHYDVLYFGELYHELFSQTHIVNWVQFIKSLYTEVVNPHSTMLIRPSSCCFYREYDLAEPHTLVTWQHGHYTPIQKYVDATNAVDWQVQNLTHDHLRSYLHGWAILTFLLYGYRKDGTCCGGIFAHPEWTIEYIVDDFWYWIGSDFIDPGWLLGALPNAIQDYLKRSIWESMGTPIWFGENLMERWLKHAFGTNPWPWYFETELGLQTLWNGIPDTLKTPATQLEYERYKVNLHDWQNTPGNRIFEPRKCSSYNTEASLALDMERLYKNSIDQGPAYLDHSWNGIKVWSTARKAGLLGALYDIVSDAFSRQPGIIDIHYFANSNSTHEHAYATLVTEATPYGGLEWDMIVFPNKTRIDLLGKHADGNVYVVQTHTYDVDEIERKQNQIEANLDSLHVNGVEQLYWNIYTCDQSNNAQLMLSADYEDAYHESPMVYDNILYQCWFSHGNPLRTPSQDPIADPIKYWPCVLRVFGLHKPTSLITGFGNSSELILHWMDQSGIEDGFKVARKIDNEEWNLEHAYASASSGAGLQVTYTDTASLCHKYQYKLRAYDNDNRRSEWSDSAFTVHGAIAESERLDMSAYNNGRKAVVVGNHLYITHASDGWVNREIILLHSNDGGMTFEEILRTGGHASHPAIVADDDGNVYVIWGRVEYLNRPQHGWYRRYHCHYLYNGVWDNAIVYSKQLNSLSETWQPPEDSIAAPSIAMSNDSGYVAFKITNQNIRIARFAIDSPTYGTYESIDDSWCNATEYLSIGYDRSKRLVIAVQTDAQNPLRLYYRKMGTNAWTYVPIADHCAYGSPALCVGTKELWVTAEADGDDGFGLHYYHIKWHGKHDDVLTYVHNMVVEPETLQENSLLKETRFGEYYYVSLVERIDDCDYDEDGVIGYSSLASPYEVVYQNNGDIMYTRKDSTGWTTPNNLSNTTKASSFPQGIPIDVGAPKLLVVWTENVDHVDEFYLIRNIIDRPGVPDPPYGGPQINYTETVKVFSFDNICPNPSNRVLKLNFTSPDTRMVSVKLYDVVGRLVDNICEQLTHIGINSIAIPTNEYAAGVYFVRVQAGSFEAVRKVTLFK